MFYSSITTFPLLVTAVFWGTMNSGWPDGRFEQWVIVSVHGLNSFFALTEIVLPATAPLPFTHLAAALAVMSLYLALAYMTRYTQGWYVYEWLNPVHGNASIILHMLWYAVGMVIIFFLVHGAMKAPLYLRSKFGQGRSHSESNRQPETHNFQQHV